MDFERIVTAAAQAGFAAGVTLLLLWFLNQWAARLYEGLLVPLLHEHIAALRRAAAALEQLAEAANRLMPPKKPDQ